MIVLFLPATCALPAEEFTLATYNLENYTVTPGRNRPLKPLLSRQKARECIQAMDADVLALQEIGGTNALLELQAALKSDGVDYPYSEWVSGFDTNIQVAILSKLPIVGRRPHSEEGFLLNGRRFRVTRGIAEVDVQVSPRYQFTLFVTHFKSRRPVGGADESDLREQEALVLRELIDARLQADPDANLAVVGDLNDVKDSRPIRALVGRGKLSLVDTRPAEAATDARNSGSSQLSSRHATWTYFYAKEDTYSRFDYILISRGMAREWQSARSYVLALPDWGLASDHRPIVARFTAGDR